MNNLLFQNTVIPVGIIHQKVPSMYLNIFINVTILLSMKFSIV